ncbi:zf-HC2 domain-containing protein [Pleionea mediterranea]|jgi:predicted anti-sigma-YlaC factor YlaD|uniref:Putative zinc finger protein n=1 Tax=Pleionea mediterranea TaxID=523701 RepID=A0A316FBZ0_9GAMM|nr:zf-HC2 domain-containing protein [Pleionea mediterranea]PWK45367.1 putative zinc finger protein [Pleionea mediterranea]
MTELCSSIEAKLSGYLDGELTQQESQRVHNHLQQCEQCNQLYRDLKSMQQDVAQLEKKTMSEEQLETLMTDKPAKTFEWAGWLLLIGGIAVIVGYLAYQFFTQDTTALWLKLTISAIYGGVAFLLLTVLRQRLIARKTDRYKGVDL